MCILLPSSLNSSHRAHNCRNAVASRGIYHTCVTVPLYPVNFVSYDLVSLHFAVSHFEPCRLASSVVTKC